MLWLRRKRDRFDTRKLYYEEIIKQVYAYGYVTLAIARMTYWIGLKVKGIGGDELKSPDTFVMNGVIHDKHPWLPFHVPCEVEFVDHSNDDDGTIGSGSLRHYEPLKSQKNDRIEERPLKLQIHITDPEKKYRYMAYDLLRDAAISGNSFAHFSFETNKVEAEEAIRLMREYECGPLLQIYSLRVTRQIISPNAPLWGWKRETDMLGVV